MTDDDATNALLIKASSLLRDSSEGLIDGAETDTVPHLLAEATHCYDAVARKLSADDGETAATVAVGRSTVAALALQRCVLDELDCDWSWEDGSDGPYLGDMQEYDDDGLSEPLVTRAVEAARAALEADTGDPLVPLQLGHALCWSGDRDGAATAYAEALRRDPGDHVAQDSLAELGEEVPEEDDVDDVGSPDRYAFALVREEARISNSEWSTITCAYGSVAAARRDADEILKSCANGDFTPEDLPSMLKLTLEIHRPEQPVTRFPAEPLDASFLIDWSGLSEGEPLDPPLPPGRPVRIDGETCFHGGLG
ncbi:tetratricopeptide repeat protein [Streptomyces sp. LZ34]